MISYENIRRLLEEGKENDYAVELVLLNGDKYIIEQNMEITKILGLYGGQLIKINGENINQPTHGFQHTYCSIINLEHCSVINLISGMKEKQERVDEFIKETKKRKENV
ncbi:MAG: hypothetical protein IJH63_00725 [Methanobrevibacter sp.]|nr:hypothetical protein [Methanosphaera sp.]MBR0369228.1 hypothetical protein [Methanobrevibacter sp.]